METTVAVMGRKGSLKNWTIHWRFIIDAEAKAEAEGIAELIGASLSVEIEGELERYPKFEHSWSCYFKTEISNLSFEQAVIRLLSSTANLVSDWTIHYDEADRYCFMIYNRTARSRFSKEEFNAVRWISADLEKAE